MKSTIPTVPVITAESRSAVRLAPIDTNLPLLASEAVLVGQARRADLVWTRGEFLALCQHMLNGNSLNHFLIAWQSAVGEPKFAKAKRARADHRASWAWDSITGRSDAKASVGFYPSNESGLSRWAAMDFDAHDGNHERARKLSLDAFTVLLGHPQLFLVLCNSGGSGFHLFIFARTLHRVEQWIRLLKQVTTWIGAAIEPGTCEIFPSEGSETNRVGKGIRAPGTINVKTGERSLIEAQTIEPLLSELPRGWLDTRAPIGKPAIGKPMWNGLGTSPDLSLYKRIDLFSLTTDKLLRQIILSHPIAKVGTRHSVLMELIGDIAYKLGGAMVRMLVADHYRAYESNLRTTLVDHLAEFEQAWIGQLAVIYGRFTERERGNFEQLGSDNQRDAFRIIWAFAGLAEKNGKTEFPIARASLADRINVSKAGASDVLNRLIAVSAIRKTTDYVPHRSATMYQWVCR